MIEIYKIEVKKIEKILGLILKLKCVKEDQITIVWGQLNRWQRQLEKKIEELEYENKNK